MTSLKSKKSVFESTKLGNRSRNRSDILNVVSILDSHWVVLGLSLYPLMFFWLRNDESKKINKLIKIRTRNPRDRQGYLQLQILEQKIRSAPLG